MTGSERDMLARLASHLDPAMDVPEGESIEVVARTEDEARQRAVIAWAQRTGNMPTILHIEAIEPGVFEVVILTGYAPESAS